MSQIAKKLEDEGYNIREMERKRDGWKAEVTGHKGKQYELRLNREGTFVREEYSTDYVSRIFQSGVLFRRVVLWFSFF